MSLKPLNHHYSMENPASVYDEEAMTALELAGRTTAKVNEAVQAFNELETQTNEHLGNQDKEISQRLKAQDEAIPVKVANEMQARVDNGDFEQAIDTYAGELEGRVNNLLGQVVEGSTSGDAELIDLRTVPNGSTFTNAGGAMRACADANSGILKASGIGENVTLKLTDGFYIDNNGKLIENRTAGWCYSAPIQVPAFRRVVLHAKGYSNSVGMINRVVSGGYETIVRCTDSNMGKFEIITSSPESLVFSFNNNTGYTLTVSMIDVNDVVEKCGLYQKAMESSGLWYEPKLEVAKNAYITPQGAVVDYDTFRISKPISVPAGHTVIFGGRGYLNHVAMINRLNTDGSYTPLVRSRTNEDGASVWDYYTYTTPAPAEIVFSYSGADDAIPRVGIFYTGAEAKNDDWVSLSVFRRFGVVGDSYASGELYYGGAYHDKYETSWGQIMAREHGTECVNFSAGGLTTRSWLGHSKGANLLNREDPCDIYYLALGINDSNHLGAEYLGGPTDIHLSNASQNADTFYGNYGKIIDAIKVHAPHAKIVLFTLHDNSEVRAQYNAAIREIASIYGIPCIVQDSDSFFTSAYYLDSMDAGHPVAVTYSGMAKGYTRLLKKCVVENIHYFSTLYEY